MWAGFSEILGQPWVATLTTVLFSAVGGLLFRRRLFKVMDEIVRGIKSGQTSTSTRNPEEAPRPPETAGLSPPATEERPLNTPVRPTRYTQRRSDEKLQIIEPREHKDKRPAEHPASTGSTNNRPGVSAATGRSASVTEERPSNTPVRPTRFTQRQFDEELRRMLREKKERGDGFAEIVSGKLHRRVVGGSTPNRMPMACNAMWKLWERQGKKEENIIYTTPSGRSSTIRIRYDFTEPE